MNRRTPYLGGSLARRRSGHRKGGPRNRARLPVHSRIHLELAVVVASRSLETSTACSRINGLLASTVTTGSGTSGDAVPKNRCGACLRPSTRPSRELRLSAATSNASKSTAQASAMLRDVGIGFPPCAKTLPGVIARVKYLSISGSWQKS